jgi:hypothetical protein
MEMCASGRASQPLLPLRRPLARHAFAYAGNSRRRHPGAGNLLDLTSRAASVVDENALPEPEVADILLASDLLGEQGRGYKSTEQDAPKRNPNGHHGRDSRRTGVILKGFKALQSSSKVWFDRVEKRIRSRK